MAEFNQLKVVYVSYHRVWTLMHGWRKAQYAELPVFSGIPEEAELMKVYFDWERDAFGFIFQHESFPKTPSNERIPAAKDTMIHVVKIPREEED